MKKLSREQFQAAEHWVLTHGRPLEQARWRHAFQGGPQEGIWDALAAYQNEDGGFGQALEPDMRMAPSSVLATQTALHVLHTIHTPADHPLHAGAIRYLVDTFDPESHTWRFLPAGVDGFPHAPWWDQTRLAETFGGFLVNPRANLLGYLLQVDEPAVEPIIRDIYGDVLQRFYETDKGLDNNSIFCYLNLVANLPAPEKARATDHLLQLAHLSIETDPAKWDTYCLKPLDLVSRPNGPFYETFAKLIDKQIDYEIERQSAAGTWEPPWSWYGNYPEVWPQAQQEWTGELTLGMIQLLDRFDRIDR